MNNLNTHNFFVYAVSEKIFKKITERRSPRFSETFNSEDFSHPEERSRCLFFCKNRAIGCFRVVNSGENIISFTRERSQNFCSFYLYYPEYNTILKGKDITRLSGKIKTLILNLYKKNTHNPEKISLSIIQSTNRIKVTLNSLKMHPFIRTYTIQITPVLQEVLGRIEHFNTIWIHGDKKINYRRMCNEGNTLFHLLFPRRIGRIMSDLVKNKPVILLRANCSFSLNVLANCRGLMCAQAPMIHYYPYLASLPEPKKQFDAVLVKGVHHDEPMNYEFTSIEKIIQSKKEIQFVSRPSLSGIRDMYELFSSARLFHYIGHGDTQGLQIAEKIFFSADDLGKVKSVPEILILSSCCGIDQLFISRFFKKGGKSLIAFRGEPASSDLVLIFKMFYWQLCNRRLDTADVVRSVKAKLASDCRAVSAMELYGQPLVYFLRPFKRPLR